MKIGLLTSSRADFGIYYPLAKALLEDSFFELEIIAFGTHLADKYGYTANEIERMGFKIKYKLETLPKGDTSQDISHAIGKTILQFADFWSQHEFDLVLALGDRYEMFAAVSAASPFNITFAHLHSGETTLGAIDNAFRHSISLMAKYLFVSTELYKQRAIEISQNPDNVFVVGALSIDNLQKQDFYTKQEFKEKFGIDLNLPSILTTFHPETVSLQRNIGYIDELLASFTTLLKKYQIIITMPNSDTMGLMIRENLIEYSKKNPQVKLIESFGMKGYLSCMKHCSFLLGNTSSGFVEAAYFPKWVINLGDRQKGRIITPNILNCKVEKEEILEKVKVIEVTEVAQNTNIYGAGNSAYQIVKTLKHIYGTK